MAGNVCADLEGAVVRYCRLADDPTAARSYQQWRQARDQFHQGKARGQVRPDGWQKDYFHGHDAEGQMLAPDHRTKVTPPPIHFAAGTLDNAPEGLA